MTEYIIPVYGGMEARIYTDPSGPMGFPAWGILFDGRAEIIAETPTIIYGAQCHAEAAATILGNLLIRAGLRPDDTWSTVEGAGLECHCEDDDDDDSVTENEEES